MTEAISWITLRRWHWRRSEFPSKYTAVSVQCVEYARNIGTTRPITRNTRGPQISIQVRFLSEVATW